MAVIDGSTLMTDPIEHAEMAARLLFASPPRGHVQDHKWETYISVIQYKFDVLFSYFFMCRMQRFLKNVYMSSLQTLKKIRLMYDY